MSWKTFIAANNYLFNGTKTFLPVGEKLS